MAVAWPVDVRKAPYRAYAVNQWLVVHEHVNGAGELAGETIPTTSFEELAAIDSVTGEATATEFQDPWRSIVRRAQIKRLAKRLERWQLSTPAWLMKKK